MIIVRALPYGARTPRNGFRLQAYEQWRDCLHASKSYTDEATGKRRFVTGTGKTQAEAIRRREANMMKRLGRMVAVSPAKNTDPTVREVTQSWLMSKGSSAPSTRYKYEADANNWIIPVFGDHPITAVDESMITHYFHRNELYAKPFPGPSVRMQIWKNMRQIWRFAAERNLIDPAKDPFLRMPPIKDYVPAVRRDDLRLINQRVDQSKMLLDHLQATNADSYNFLLMLFLGLRVMQAAGIEHSSLSDLDVPGKAALSVHQQLFHDNETHVDSIRTVTKNKRERQIFLPERFRQALVDERAKGRQIKDKQFHDLVFVAEDDKGVMVATTHYRVRKMWGQAWKGVGMDKPPFRIHYCRAVTASIILQIDGSASSYEALKQVIGNSSLASNLYYSHLMEETRKGASSTIEQWLGADSMEAARRVQRGEVEVNIPSVGGITTRKQ